MTELPPLREVIARHGLSARIGRLADVPAARACGIHDQIHPQPLRLGPQRRLRQRRATDVAETDEEDGSHGWVRCCAGLMRDRVWGLGPGLPVTPRFERRRPAGSSHAVQGFDDLLARAFGFRPEKQGIDMDQAFLAIVLNLHTRCLRLGGQQVGVRVGDVV